MTLKSLEHEFIINDAQLFNEFDNSHFISNARSAITNKVQAVNMNMKFDYYTSMLEKAVESFSIIKLDSSTISEFLSKFDNISKLDDVQMVTKDICDTNAIIFKPQYLAQYVSMVQIALDKAINGNISREEIVRYVSGEIPEKVKRQVVASNQQPIVYGLSNKELYKNNSLYVNMVPVNTVFVKNKVMPFVTKYPTIKTNMLTEVNSVINSIRETEETVRAMLTAIETMKSNGSISGDKIQLLNLISYNTIRGVIEVISFVSYMVLKKINCVSDSIMTCNKLYNDIGNLYDSNVIESAFDQNILPTDSDALMEELIEGRADAFITLANNIYQFHANLPEASQIENQPDSNVVNQEVDQHDYDDTVYNNIAKSYIEISTGLDVIASEGDQFLLVYDDIIAKSGFLMTLTDRFQNEIRALSDLSGDKMNMIALLAEVKNYDENAGTIAKIIAETYKKLKYLQKRFADNNNGEYTDVETINELKIFLGGLSEQYQKMTKLVGNALYNRLKALGEAIASLKDHQSNILKDKTIPLETSSNLDLTESVDDYNDIACISFVEYCDTENKLFFNELQKSYYVEKELELRGVKTFFEADTPETNTGSNTQNNTNNNTQTDNKADTKVTVQDNSNQAQSGADKVASNVSKFIRDTVDRFLQFIGKSANKNTKWLNNNKQELLGRSYSNVTVNILPYNNISSQQILDDIGKLTNNIKTITPQVLQSVTNKDAMFMKLFSFISPSIKEANGTLSEQLTKYYKVGSGELKVQPISNGELKTEITNVIIPYCEAYYGQYKDSLDQKLSDLGKAFDSASSSYNTVDSNVKTESVSIFTEADANVNTETSMKEKTKWMNEAVRFFTGSILNAVRDRNADYLKVLSSLLPKTPKEPVKSEAEKNEDNNKNNNANDVQQ